MLRAGYDKLFGLWSQITCDNGVVAYQLLNCLLLITNNKCNLSW